MIIIVNPTHRLLDENYAELGDTGKLIVKKRLRNTISFVRNVLQHAKDPYDQPAWHHNFRTMKRVINVPAMNEAVLHASLLCNLPEELDIPMQVFYKAGYPWNTLAILDTINQPRLREDRGRNFKEWIIWMSKYGSLGSRIIKLAELYDWIAQMKKWGVENQDQNYVTFIESIAILEPTIPDKALEAIVKD